MSKTINISKDYTRFPAGRYPEDGRGNGTDFRRRFLVPVLRQEETAVVDLDGAVGYPSSFLEEAFGGLVRKEGYSKEQILRTFNFKASQPGFSRFEMMIKKYIETAEKEVPS